MELENKICLVTGGTKGIGAATALEFAKAGADVIINGRQLDADAEETREAVLAIGRRCAVVLADCARPEDAKRCVNDAAERLGPIDVLVHSAGGPVNGGLLDLTPDRWYAAFDIHVHAIFHLARAVIPMMRQKKEGAIVLVSSTAGLRAVHTHVAYQVVKGALPHFTRALAREFAGDNIRVNCVAPGVIRTAFHANMSEEQKRLNLEHRIPLRREGAPAQVASLVLELVRNDYITGETMTIDGGLTMRIA